MKRALVSVYTFLIGIFLTSTTHGFDVITISGDNPQMDIRGKVNGQEEFKYTSYGTRQLGVGARIEEHWLSLTLADPRDSDAQRTNRALIEYRHFSEIQWGLSLSHFKNFELNDGSNREDLEIYQTHGFILKNLNNSDYLVEKSLFGLDKVENSDWAFFGGAKLSNSYIHGDSAVVPSSISRSDDVNNINGYTLGGMIGIGGTVVLGHFYIASHLSLGVGPTYTTWADRSGRSEKFGLSLINSHIYDFAIGYSSDNLSVIFKTSTMSDSLQTSKVDFQNLSQSMGLILTYRF
jgi:hypothetical protein